MNKDKALEELFLAQKPHFEDCDDFIASLAKRLDAVEYIKHHQETTIRRYKMAMVVAFLAGIISGSLAIMYLLSTPADVPLFTFNLQNSFLVWLAANSRLITAIALSLLMTFGIVSIISNIQDIQGMRLRKEPE